ncbi:MAG: amidase family protein [Bradyrhizobium sp.]
MRFVCIPHDGITGTRKGAFLTGFEAYMGLRASFHSFPGPAKVIRFARVAAMKLGEYLQHDALGLAQCVVRGETTPAELLEVALEQSVLAQPKTNAICRLMESEARSQLAKPLVGRFAGAPFLIKDCAQDYAGLPTSYGSKSMLGLVAREHSNVVRRYLGAGLVIFGKTNLPEFALKGVSDSQLFGRASFPRPVAACCGLSAVAGRAGQVGELGERQSSMARPVDRPPLAHGNRPTDLTLSCVSTAWSARTAPTFLPLVRPTEFVDRLSSIRRYVV